MEETQDQLPQDLAVLADKFEFAAAPFEGDRTHAAAPGGHAAMLEVAGFLVGVVGLLVSLISVYTSGNEARRKRVPDFEDLLDRLVAGNISPEKAIAELARWKPDLTPGEVAEQWRNGNIARYEEVLGVLGFPPQIVAEILRNSFGAIAALEKGS